MAHSDVIITVSDQHRENMEHMATEVSHCLHCAVFGGNSLHSYRGINNIFDDEDTLKTKKWNFHVEFTNPNKSELFAIIMQCQSQL